MLCLMQHGTIISFTLFLATSHVDSFHLPTGISQNWQKTISIDRSKQRNTPSEVCRTGYRCIPLCMVKYEDLVEKLPSKAVLDVVEQSPRKDAVIASDVASAAGISLSQARKDLTTLAALARADLAVTKDGELIYTFPDNIKSVLAQNSAKYQLLQYVEKAWPLVFWLVRVSFGVALLASLVASSSHPHQIMTNADEMIEVACLGEVSVVIGVHHRSTFFIIVPMDIMATMVQVRIIVIPMIWDSWNQSIHICLEMATQMQP
jgi:hypothetical protein